MLNVYGIDSLVYAVNENLRGRCAPSGRNIGSRAVADLDVDRIVTVALAVCDERGAEGFSMRAVADALGVTPMALYRHVKDKRDLVGLLVSAAVLEEALPAPTGEWKEDLWQVACWARNVTRRHPALSRLRRALHVWAPSVLPITERWFSVWQQSGLALDLAMKAGTMSSLAIIGVVEEELLFERMIRPGDDLLGAAPNARLAFQQKGDSEERFEIIVRSLIEGLHAHLSRAAASVTTQKIPGGARRRARVRSARRQSVGRSRA